MHSEFSICPFRISINLSFFIKHIYDCHVFFVQFSDTNIYKKTDALNQQNHQECAINLIVKPVIGSL